MSHHATRSAALGSARQRSAARWDRPLRPATSPTLHSTIKSAFCMRTEEVDGIWCVCVCRPCQVYHWYDECIPHFWLLYLHTVQTVTGQTLSRALCLHCLPLSAALIPCIILEPLASHPAILHSCLSFTLNSYLLTKGSLSMYKLFKGFLIYWQHSWLYTETTLLHPLNSLLIKYYS